MKLFELYADLELNAKGFESGVKKASKQGGNLAYTLKNTIGGAATFVGNKVSATTVMLGNLMADAVKSGANMGKQLAQTGMQYNAQMETYVTNFRTMLGGSSEAAEKLTGDLEDMAASTPFAMTDLADATQTLLAFGQESSTVLDTLQTLGDISMGDANKLQSLTLAFAQASSSGKLMGQDLMQMVNAGFNPLQTVVEKTGVSMGDLKDFMSTGKASTDLKRAMRAAKKEVKAFGDEASEGAKMLVQMQEDGAISAELLGQIFAIETSPGGKFYQAMEAASKTFNGLMSTLQDDSTALLGKVFKPLSDWMVDDLLPNGIEAIGKLSDAYDVGGWSEMVKVGTGMIETELNRIGSIAVDAGAGLLANFYTGLTGDETSADDVKEFISGLIDDVVVAKDKGIGIASDFLDGLAEGLTGEENSSKEDIVSTIGSLFSGGLQDIQELKEAGAGLLGTLYTEISGQEATAENIGKTIGGIFNAGTTAADGVIQKSTSFLSEVDKALGSDTSAKDKVASIFEAGIESSKTLLEIAKNFGFDLYAALNEEEAAKAEKEFDDNLRRFNTFGGKAKDIAATAFDWVADKVESTGEYGVERTMRNPLYEPISGLVNDTAIIIQDAWSNLEKEGQAIKEATSAQWYMMKYTPDDIEAAVNAIKQSDNNGESAVITGINGEELIAAYESRQTDTTNDIVAASSAAASAAVADAPVPVLNVTIPVYVGDTEVANVIYPALLNKMTRELNNARYSK